jgi:hypothetical protein
MPIPIPHHNAGTGRSTASNTSSSGSPVGGHSVNGGSPNLNPNANLGLTLNTTALELDDRGSPVAVAHGSPGSTTSGGSSVPPPQSATSSGWSPVSVPAGMGRARSGSSGGSPAYELHHHHQQQQQQQFHHAHGNGNEYVPRRASLMAEGYLMGMGGMGGMNGLGHNGMGGMNGLAGHVGGNGANGMMMMMM